MLHKESIGDYFLDNLAHTEQLGRHIRSFVPRQNALELADQDLTQVNLADYITPTNIVFPNVCMIGHPTSISIISLFPGQGPWEASWRHMLLTPEKPESDQARAHYDKTIAVLDETTYEREDFWVSEQVQAGVEAGALDEMLLGANEYMLKVFDDALKASL